MGPAGGSGSACGRGTLEWGPSVRWPNALKAESLRCSFCRKSQDSVSKLISNPSDYPKAYICNECISVCVSVLEDDRGSSETSDANVEVADEPHPLLRHPLASSLLAAVESWVRQESLGMDSAEEFAEVRDIAVRLISTPGATK